MTKKKMGIFAKKDKTFYYLETGGNYVNDDITRIKRALLQRGLIWIDPETNSDKDQYTVLTFDEAKDKEYQMKPIFLNNFIKQNFLKEQESPAKSKWS